MGFFKIIGGAALGIAAVVALPVFGAIGSITVVGAAVAATVGGVAGGAASSKEKRETASSVNEAYERGRAERVEELLDLQRKFEEAAKRFQTHRALEEFLVAAFAVAIAVAHADGSFSDEERSEIEEIISGASYESLPKAVRANIKKLYDSPPTLEAALRLVKPVDPAAWETFDRIIEAVIAVDGVEHPAETACRETWAAFKVANQA